MERWQTAGFGLYVHWPFCQSKCPYCDFNSHVSAQIDQQEWRDAYLAELRRYEPETAGRVLTSIFFGGGTPSLMDPSLVASIIEEAGKIWTFANDIEITLEANPTSVEIDKFRGFHLAGVNRVSVGVQALDDQDLRRLGRMHDAQEALRAIDVSQKVFARTNFDLIYARQDQTIEAWKKELEFAFSVAAGHLSLYQLTIEPGTVFGARFDKGLLAGLPTEDLSADMFELTQDLCEAHGRPAYEVSNHATPGDQSKHNLIYWNCGDYAAVGPGAHGRLTQRDGTRAALVRPPAPAAWLAAAKNGTDWRTSRETLSKTDEATERVIMGLRLTSGIDLADLSNLAPSLISAQKINSLVNMGFIQVTDSHVATTRAGRLVLNAVIKELLA